MTVPAKIASPSAGAPPPNRTRIADEIMDRIRRTFVIGMAILLTAGLGSYFALERYRSSNANVANSDEVIGQLNDLLSNLDRAEAVERGYITNGGNGYILSMPPLAAAIDQDLDELNRAAGEGMLPQSAVDTLAAQAKGKLKFYDQLAATRAAQGEPAAAAMFTAGQAHNFDTDIHDRVQQMSAAQQRRVGA